MNSFSLSIVCPRCGQANGRIGLDSIECESCGNRIAKWDEGDDQYKWTEPKYEAEDD